MHTMTAEKPVAQCKTSHDAENTARNGSKDSCDILKGIKLDSSASSRYVPDLILVHKVATELNPLELDACYKLVRRIRGMYIGGHEVWDRRRKLSEMQDTPGLQYLIWAQERLVAAFASYTLEDDFEGEKCAYLWEIHVDPRFQRHGLGRELIQEVLERAKRAAKPLFLRCFKSNQRARTFYEQAGFEVSFTDEYSIYYKKAATPAPASAPAPAPARAPTPASLSASAPEHALKKRGLEGAYETQPRKKKDVHTRSK